MRCGVRSYASSAFGSGSRSPTDSARPPSPRAGSSRARGLRSATIKPSTRAAELVSSTNLVEGWFAPMRLEVLAPCASDPRELADRAVREHHRTGELGDELLHRLADPPRRIRPSAQLAAADGDRAAVETRHARESAGERLDACADGLLLAALRGNHQLRAALRCSRRVSAAETEPGPQRQPEPG